MNVEHSNSMNETTDEGDPGHRARGLLGSFDSAAAGCAVPRHGIRQHGGFLRQKSTTLIIGVKPERIDNALALIREVCASAPDSAEHNATVFVLEAEQFIHF